MLFWLYLCLKNEYSNPRKQKKNIDILKLEHFLSTRLTKLQTTFSISSQPQDSGRGQADAGETRDWLALPFERFAVGN